MSLDSLFRPRSVAVIGASNDKTKFGGRISHNIFASNIHAKYFITRHSDDILGNRTYRSLEDLPVVPDLIVLAVAADSALDFLQNAAELGSRAAIVFASGFSEEGENGCVRQENLIEIAKRYRVSVLGPNCIGFADFTNRTYLCSGEGLTSGEAGSTALITQSGSLGLALSSRNRKRLKYLVATGNEAVVRASDIMLYLLEADAAISTFALVLETVRDREGLARASDIALERGKRVLLLKSSGTQVANKIAKLHTGAVSGETAPLEAFCDQHGIHLAKSLRQFAGALDLLTTPYKGGRRLGIFTTSGGSAVLGAGFAHSQGLALPEPNPSVCLAVANQMGMSPERVTNPLDTTGIYAMDSKRFGEALSSFAGSGDFDLVLVPLGGSAGANVTSRVKALKKAAAASPVPIIPIWQHVRRYEEEGFRDLYDSDLRLFTDYETPMEALSLISSKSAIDNPTELLSPSGRIDETLGHDAPSLRYSLESLAAHKVSVPPFLVVTDETAAETIFQQLGRPIALKVSHSKLLHKSDTGMVVYPVVDELQLKREIKSLRHNVSTHNLEGAEIIAQAGMTDAVELLCGFNRDVEMGPYAVIAAGGVYVELLSDTSIVLLEPAIGVDSRVERALRSLRIWPVLEGYRGKKGFDWQSAIKQIRQMSEYFLGNSQIAAMEVNPLCVLKESLGAIVIDARMLLGNKI
jgi:acetate---CoA ligase (ADP-forming)